MEGIVYLITELDNSKKCKIGVTKNRNVTNRLNQLQTGNSSELFIIKQYTSKHPFKLEKWLHRYFAEKHKINEWYILEETDIDNFITICEKYETMLNSLNDNPFFK